MKKMLSKCFVIALALVSLHAVAQTTKAIKGDVVSVDGHTLRVKEATGQAVDVTLRDDARVSVRAPSSLSAIKQGEFVGVTAKPDANGKLVASQVQVFAESMRGLAEGHRPMANLPGNTMTNATIANVSSTPARSQNSMTNATVASVGATVSAKLLHLTYKGGSQDILVPDNVAVLTLEPGSLASLTPGAHVIVYVSESPDGKLSSSRISVGKNGSMPPV